MAKNLTTERAAVRIARNIVQDIQARELRPGSPLDPEHVMVEKLGVARATVREALRFLELQGALRIKAGPGGGPVVSVPDTGHLASAISLQLQFANATFQSVVDARMSIYPVLAGEAAQNATHQHIQAIHQSTVRMRSATKDSDLLAQETRQFHNLVADASGNMVLGFLVKALHRMSEGAGIQYNLKQRKASVEKAEKVLLAIEAGDAEAARKVTEEMLAAALRYWKKTAPELLDNPVSWLADLPRENLVLPELQVVQP
ncbi:MAG TPA: FadR family transcriptional regulator [Gammaproteobacteria bacterium]|nr:FadR family transcriptional regulator [Gammaproteobacteria bacterium]